MEITHCQCWLADKNRYCGRVPLPGKKYCWQHTGGKCKSASIHHPLPSHPLPKAVAGSPLQKGKPYNKLLTGVADLDIDILLNLPYWDLVKICQTNKEGEKLCANPTLWQRRILKYYLNNDQTLLVKSPNVTWRQYHGSFVFVIPNLYFVESVIEVAKHVNPNISVSESGIKLLRRLLNPLIRKLADVSTIDRLTKDFLDKEFPPNLAVGTYGSFKLYTPHHLIGIISFLISHLIRLAGQQLRDEHTNVIGPLAIYKAIIEDEELFEYFRSFIKPFVYRSPYAIDKKDMLLIKDLRKFGLSKQLTRVLQWISIAIGIYYLDNPVPPNTISDMVTQLGYKLDAGKPLKSLEYAIISVILKKLRGMPPEQIGFDELLDATVNNHELNEIVPLTTIFRYANADAKPRSYRNL